MGKTRQLLQCLKCYKKHYNQQDKNRCNKIFKQYSRFLGPASYTVDNGKDVRGNPKHKKKQVKQQLQSQKKNDNLTNDTLSINFSQKPIIIDSQFQQSQKKQNVIYFDKQNRHSNLPKVTQIDELQVQSDQDSYFSTNSRKKTIKKKQIKQIKNHVVQSYNDPDQFWRWKILQQLINSKQNDLKRNGFYNLRSRTVRHQRFQDHQYSKFYKMIKIENQKAAEQQIQKAFIQIVQSSRKTKKQVIQQFQQFQQRMMNKQLINAAKRHGTPMFKLRLLNKHKYLWATPKSNYQRRIQFLCQYYPFVRVFFNSSGYTCLKWGLLQKKQKSYVKNNLDGLNKKQQAKYFEKSDKIKFQIFQKWLDHQITSNLTPAESYAIDQFPMNIVEKVSQNVNNMKQKIMKKRQKQLSYDYQQQIRELKNICIDIQNQGKYLIDIIKNNPTKWIRIRRKLRRSKGYWGLQQKFRKEFQSKVEKEIQQKVKKDLQSKDKPQIQQKQDQWQWGNKTIQQLKQQLDQENKLFRQQKQKQYREYMQLHKIIEENENYNINQIEYFNESYNKYPLPNNDDWQFEESMQQPQLKISLKKQHTFKFGDIQIIKPVWDFQKSVTHRKFLIKPPAQKPGQLQFFTEQMKKFMHKQGLSLRNFYFRQNIFEKQFKFDKNKDKRKILKLNKQDQQLLDDYSNYKYILPIRYRYINSQFGSGLQASRDIQKYQIVGFFNGLILKNSQGNKLKNNHNMMQYVLNQENDNDSFVVTTCHNVWGIGPMFNHANSKNCNVTTVGMITKNGLQYIMYTNKNVKQGQHLTWNYQSGGQNYGTSGWKNIQIIINQLDKKERIVQRQVNVPYERYENFMEKQQRQYIQLYQNDQIQARNRIQVEKKLKEQLRQKINKQRKQQRKKRVQQDPTLIQRLLDDKRKIKQLNLQNDKSRKMGSFKFDFMI